MLPRVDALQVVQLESHHTLRGVEEAEVAAHEVGLGQPEGGMVLAQLDEFLVVVEHLGITLQVVPVELIDAVGRVEGVVHALLAAQHLLAAEDEGHTLRGEHGGLGQLVESDEFLVADAGDGGAQSVDEAHVVVAAHIADHLRGVVGPGLLAVVHPGHVDLRMVDAAGYAKLQALLQSRHTGKEAPLVVVAEGSAEGVAHVVAERPDAMEPLGVGLHGELLRGIGTLPCAPPLAIDVDGGVDAIHHLAYLVHRLDVVHAHEVEAEAVDVVLVDPIFHALLHEGTHDGLVGGRLVAAARAVAWRAVGIETIVGARPRELEVAVVEVEGVVVYHVEDYADARLVQCLHHLLELAYAHGGVIGVGAVAALRHVVVERVVAPVVLRHVEAGLIHRGVVERGQDVDGVHAEALQIVDGLGFGEGKELALMRQARGGRHGEVAEMHLVDDEVGGRLQLWPTVMFPAGGIGLGHVDDGSPLAIDSHGGGEDSGSLTWMLLVAADVESVVFAFPFAFHGGQPAPALVLFHPHRLERSAAKRLAVESQHNALALGRTAEKGERSRLVRIAYLGKIVEGHCVRVNGLGLGGDAARSEKSHKKRF